MTGIGLSDPSTLRSSGIFLQQRPESPEILRRLVSHWFYAALDCRHELGRSDQPPVHLRSVLSSLIAFGEWAQLEAERMRIDFSPIGLTLDDVKAETRLLRDTFRSAYENSLSEAEAEAVLKDVFG